MVTWSDSTPPVFSRSPVGLWEPCLGCSAPPGCSARRQVAGKPGPRPEVCLGILGPCQSRLVLCGGCQGARDDYSPQQVCVDLSGRGPAGRVGPCAGGPEMSQGEVASHTRERMWQAFIRVVPRAIYTGQVLSLSHLGRGSPVGLGPSCMMGDSAHSAQAAPSGR